MFLALHWRGFPPSLLKADVAPKVSYVICYFSLLRNTRLLLYTIYRCFWHCTGEDFLPLC